jgi:hypothetical protein
MPVRIWSRWKDFAQRAAEVQAHVLFFLLYFVVLVPLASISSRDPGFRRRRGAVEMPPSLWDPVVSLLWPVLNPSPPLVMRPPLVRATRSQHPAQARARCNPERTYVTPRGDGLRSPRGVNAGQNVT